MKDKIKLFFVFLLLGMSCQSYSQQLDEIKLNAEKVKQFLPYMKFRHGVSQEGFDKWKSTNKMLYAKEMWYYSESFYVKRNVSDQGVTLDESMIDISRFEQHRKQNEEAIVPLQGYKDVLVLLPADKLIYKP